MKPAFGGLYPPLPTPFAEDGALAPDRLRRLVGHLNDTGLAGYLALGSNGEAVHVSPEEASVVFETVRKAAALHLKVLGGAGQLSTRATIEMARRASGAGCDAVLVLPPFYYRGAMTAEALRRHFEAVADASPIPVLLYNVPANTGLDLPLDVVAQLAKHPNVAGIKDSAGDVGRLAETVHLARRAGHPFDVLSGNFAATLPSLTFGVTGAILAVANVAPRECGAILECFRAGRMAEAGELHLRLLPVARAVTSRWGVPGLKAALDLLGLPGGPPRPPLLPLGPAARSELADVLRGAGLPAAA